MKTSFVALAAIVLAAFIAAVLWKSPPRAVFDWMRPNDGALRRAQAEREAARLASEKQLAEQQLREQRRERLTLLTAALGVQPVAQLTRAETQLFQQAERARARHVAAAERRSMVRLREPVQIDEWTVLHAGTAVELIHYDRDNVVTVGYDGARYQVGTHQIAER
jgi:hypothetical protein